MKKRYAVGSVIAILLMAFFTVSALATDSRVFLVSDQNGQNPVTLVQEGDEVWIAVYDPDENLDCDDLDKMSPDIKLMDPKTGAYIVWNRNPNFNPQNPGVGFDYFVETGPDTGLFVSNRSFQIGTRVVYNVPRQNTHVVDDVVAAAGNLQALFNAGMMFQWGHYIYDTGVAGALNVAGDDRGWFSNNGAFNVGRMPANTIPFLPPANWGGADLGYLMGRFENNDTLVLAYQDRNDPRDVSVGMAKIKDTEGEISWGQEIYKDANGAAEINICDLDENLNCNAIEYVPVFVIVNPGSWNPVDWNPGPPPANPTGNSPANFCMLKRNGGVNAVLAVAGNGAPVARLNRPIRWFNIYDSGIGPIGAAAINNQQEKPAGTYYMQYPTTDVGMFNNVTTFETVDDNGVVQVMFWAQETGVNTGCFRLQINSLLRDLGFASLDVGDVLVAYYLDPNDFDDFKLATAYIESKDHISITSFTDAARNSMNEYRISEDPIYVQVIDQNANVDPCCPEQVVVHICDPHEEDDSEWVVLDETTSNSPIFFTNSGMPLLPVWDALGVGLVAFSGGYQLQVDNWKFEAYNEDDVYARYNDVYYEIGPTGHAGLGDSNWLTAFPPAINRIRVDNDVSFDRMNIYDFQVYDGIMASDTNMYFLDRLGNKVSGYVNSDCVFIKVIDKDQNEDHYRRERVDAYWDWNVNAANPNTGQNIPFGPVAFNWLNCGVIQLGVPQTHPVNPLLGATNIDDRAAPAGDEGTMPQIYVLNPRNARWAAIDILETGVGTGEFVSVTCIPLVDPEVCAKQLAVLPGDTIVAVYKDPSNHSDSSWVGIKVGVGGGGTPPSQQSTTMFVDEAGASVNEYTDAESVYVKVTDPNHSGQATLTGLEVEGVAYDLTPGASPDTFMTDAISLADLGAVAGDTITATYTDVSIASDTSTDTADIIASVLVVDDVLVMPNPFDDEAVFTFEGSGIPDTITVEIYDLNGHPVWSDTKANVTEIVWDGTDEAGMSVANGPYFYVMTLTGADDPIAPFKGKVFIHR